MTPNTRIVEHQIGGVALQAALVGDAGARRPCVLVFHGLEGRSEAQEDFARQLTDWGYAGFAVDLFGVEASAGGIEQLQVHMGAFMENRALLAERLLEVVEVARSQPEVDADRVAAIGFCFGGLCALDLARTGTDVRSVTSFHGVLTAPDGHATRRIPAKVAVHHGWDDPYAPPADVVALGKELTEAHADWQIHAYGHTMHSFMAPNADNPEAGIAYNPVTARRAWASLERLLAESLT